MAKVMAEEWTLENVDEAFAHGANFGGSLVTQCALKGKSLNVFSPVVCMPNMFLCSTSTAPEAYSVAPSWDPSRGTCLTKSAPKTRPIPNSDFCDRIPSQSV